MMMRYGRGMTPFGPVIAIVDEHGRLAELSIDVDADVVGRAKLGVDADGAGTDGVGAAAVGAAVVGAAVVGAAVVGADVVADVVGRAKLGAGAEVNLQQGATLDQNACEHVFKQLDEYFAGMRRDFNLPLALEGSDFELGVWRELLAIPFGSTDSYGALARRLGAQTYEGARAVGQAAGANRIPIVVPCHRLVGSDGKLVGYALGLPMKQCLLDLESAAPRLL